MAMGAAWKVRRIVRNLQHIIGIELMCGAQALDYRAPLTAGIGAAAAHRAVRKLVPTLESDRVMHGDMAMLAEAVADGVFDPVVLEVGNGESGVGNGESGIGNRKGQ
jgi:histidine ammonia-lyase